MKKLIIVLACIIVVFSSCYHNPIERNTIVFNDKAQDVQKYLTDMEELLTVMPKSRTELYTNYYFRADGLYINNSYVGNIDKIKVDTVNAFSNFSVKQKNDFITLSKSLKRNFITAGFYDRNLNSWLYKYRTLPDEDYHDTREILLLKKSTDVEIGNRINVLDRNSMMILFAPKDAKIRNL